jgi:hypothetical protein
VKELLLVKIKTNESEKIKKVLDQNKTDYEIIYQNTIVSIEDLADKELEKRKEEEEKRRIEFARVHLAEIGNSDTLRKEFEATEKASQSEGIEAYWKLQDKLSRELTTHLINYKGHDEATHFC